MKTAKHSLVLALLAALLLGGCGGGGGETGGSDTQVAETMPAPSEESRAPWVAMDGWDSAETIGVVMAIERELFSKANLEVTTLSPVSPGYSIPDVLNGSDEIAVAYGPQAIITRSKGAPLVVIGSLVPHPTAALIWPKDSGIDGIADLEGKTIAIPGLPFQEDFLGAMLAQDGLTLADVRVETVNNKLTPALLSGKADAIFGGSANQEGVELEDRGVEPVVTPVGEAGVPDYEELVLVAREDRAGESPRAMRDFVAAVAEGATMAVADPAAAARALDGSGESNPETSAAAFEASMRQTAPLVSTDGQPSEEKTEDLADWMYEQEMIATEVSASELLAGP
jgi:putative hydroxymethylpyrimidine transport system substrate-binding protein